MDAHRMGLCRWYLSLTICNWPQRIEYILYPSLTHIAGRSRFSYHNDICNEIRCTPHSRGRARIHYCSYTSRHIHICCIYTLSLSFSFTPSLYTLHSVKHFENNSNLKSIWIGALSLYIINANDEHLRRVAVPNWRGSIPASTLEFDPFLWPMP